MYVYIPIKYYRYIFLRINFLPGESKRFATFIHYFNAVPIKSLLPKISECISQRQLSLQDSTNL